MTYESALSALADGTRRSVFEELRAGPRSVGDIAAQLPVSRPAVSQHLKVLKEAGLVIDHAEGTKRLYSINTNGLGELRRWLDQFWDVALESFKAHVEANEGKLHGSVKRSTQDSRRTGTQKRARQRRRRTRV